MLCHILALIFVIHVNDLLIKYLNLDSKILYIILRASITLCLSKNNEGDILLVSCMQNTTSKK